MRAAAFILFVATLTLAQPGCSIQWLGVAIYEERRERELDRIIEERQLEARK